MKNEGRVGVWKNFYIYLISFLLCCIKRKAKSFHDWRWIFVIRIHWSTRLFWHKPKSLSKSLIVANKITHLQPRCHIAVQKTLRAGHGRKIFDKYLIPVDWKFLHEKREKKLQKEISKPFFFL